MDTELTPAQVIMRAEMQSNAWRQNVENQKAIINLMAAKLTKIEDRAREALTIGTTKEMQSTLADIIKIKQEAKVK